MQKLATQVSENVLYRISPRWLNTVGSNQRPTQFLINCYSASTWPTLLDCRFLLMSAEKKKKKKKKKKKNFAFIWLLARVRAERLAHESIENTIAYMIWERAYGAMRVFRKKKAFILTYGCPLLSTARFINSKSESLPTLYDVISWLLRVWRERSSSTAQLLKIRSHISSLLSFKPVSCPPLRRVAAHRFEVALEYTFSTECPRIAPTYVRSTTQLW